MEQKLINELRELETKIVNDEKFNEKELVSIKNAFEEISGTKVNSMMSCAGKLCEVFRRVLINWLKSNPKEIERATPLPIKIQTPVKVEAPKAIEEKAKAINEFLSIGIKKGVIKDDYKFPKTKPIKKIKVKKGKKK